MRTPRRLLHALPSAGRPPRTLSISPPSHFLGCRAQVPPGPGESGDRGLQKSRADKALASHRPPDVSRELQLLSLLYKARLLPAAIASARPRLHQGPPLLPRAEPARSHPLQWPTPRWTDTCQTQRGRRACRAQETRPGPQHPLCSQPPPHPLLGCAPRESIEVLIADNKPAVTAEALGSRDGGRLLAGVAEDWAPA